MIFSLTRPKPKLPNSYFWTWDHSTNWVLDDPGVVNFGCQNRYLKRPETFVEDYRILTDFAKGLGVKGIVIWGFIRDSHGGVEYSKKVASYAQSKGIAIMPGIGTTHYGGVYYEGNHKYNIDTFLKKNPSAGAITPEWLSTDNKVHSVCPSNPVFREWIEEGLKWLFDEFDIGGCNLENGDFFVCNCPKCTAHKDNWPASDSDFFRYQAIGYESALNIAGNIVSKDKRDLLITWATYCGFVPGKPDESKGIPHFTPHMGCEKPEIYNRVNYEGITQWTLTGMVHQKEIPLTVFLDEGKPGEVYGNSIWGKEIKPPSKHSVGFIHQGSQWCNKPRYSLTISTIKEACLRAYEAGLEGVSIHGEVTSRHIPYALNYLAFSHFIHWPEDSLREFGRKTLGEVFGDPKEGEDFVENLAFWDAGLKNDEIKKRVKERYNKLLPIVSMGNTEPLDTKFVRFLFWNWLYRVVSGIQDPMDAFF